MSPGFSNGWIIPRSIGSWNAEMDGLIRNSVVLAVVIDDIITDTTGRLSLDRGNLADMNTVITTLITTPAT